jgi:hypothetical protein
LAVTEDDGEAYLPSRTGGRQLVALRQAIGEAYADALAKGINPFKYRFDLVVHDNVIVYDASATLAAGTLAEPEADAG